MSVALLMLVQMEPLGHLDTLLALVLVGTPLVVMSSLHGEVPQFVALEVTKDPSQYLQVKWPGHIAVRGDSDPTD